MQISLVQWVYLIFVVYLIFLIRCLGIVINTSSIFGVQDVLGWPWTLSGAICCLCLLIISLFFCFCQFGCFFTIVICIFYYCCCFFSYFCCCDCYFIAFCEHGHANYGLIFCFPTCFFVYFSFGCSTCSGKRRWRYVWGIYSFVST